MHTQWEKINLTVVQGGHAAARTRPKKSWVQFGHDSGPFPTGQSAKCEVSKKRSFFFSETPPSKKSDPSPGDFSVHSNDQRLPLGSLGPVFPEPKAALPIFPGKDQEAEKLQESFSVGC